MRGFFFWLAALCGIGYLCYKFAAWHALVQLALIVALVAWVVIGVALLGRGMRDRGHRFETKPRPNLATDMIAARNAVASKYGEAYMAGAEQANPQIWKEIALGLRPQP